MFNSDIRNWKKIMEDFHTDVQGSDEGTHDHEASMARGQLYHIAKDSIKLIEMIKKGDNLEGWVASKITKAKENISVVADYIESSKTVNSENRDTENDPFKGTSIEGKD